VRHCSRTRESALEQNCLRWLTPAELRLLDPTKIRFHAAHAHGKAEPRPVWVPPRPPVDLGVRSLLVGVGLSNGAGGGVEGSRSFFVFVDPLQVCLYSPYSCANEMGSRWTSVGCIATAHAQCRFSRVCCVQQKQGTHDTAMHCAVRTIRAASHADRSVLSGSCAHCTFGAAQQPRTSHCTAVAPMWHRCCTAVAPQARERMWIDALPIIPTDIPLLHRQARPN
jgi:hypothetical protein